MKVRHPGDWTERYATDEEIAAWRAEPVTEDDREKMLRLIHWFLRRYPTYAELATYIRLKILQAESLRGAALQDARSSGRGG